MDLKKIRKDFPILNRKIRGKPLVYLDNAATSQKPQSVIDALVSFYGNHNANIHRGVHTLSDEATQMVDDARAKTAAFIKAPEPESVIFTRNTSESINLVARTWARSHIKAGDEILLTELEHHSNLVPWQMLAADTGVLLRHIPITADGLLDLEAAQKLVSKKTKLIAFTAMSNALGTISPVKELIALAKSVGAKTLVDGAQWVPHLPTDVTDWDCDFLAFSAHKMLGPTGIGVLYGRRSLLEEMDPFLGGGDMIQQVFLDRFTPNVLPHKFEAGTPNIADIIAFGAGLDYLTDLGLDAVVAHERDLVGKAIKALSVEGVTLYGPSDLSKRGGVVSFNIEGIHPHDVGTAFDLEGVAIRAGHHCCQPLMRRLKIGGTARASFYIYNTDEDVQALARALKSTIDFFKGGRKPGKKSPLAMKKRGVLNG